MGYAALGEFLSSRAPFLAANWPLAVILGTLLLGLVVAFACTKPRKPRNASGDIKKAPPPAQPSVVKNSRGRQKPKEKGDDPMAEFEDEAPEADVVAPPLHSADTPHIVYPFKRRSETEMKERATDFYRLMNTRRSVRDLSSDQVPVEIINDIIRTAGTSPSGAHCEPWTFVVIQDPKIKLQIREIIEQEEYLNYDHRMGEKWVSDLKFIGTTNDKPYLETAPYIIVVFKQQYHIGDNGVRYAHYYYEISTAIATGILVTAIHNAGLVTVVTTPLNAGGSLRELLGRPANEKVMVLLPVGYPADGAEVPDVSRKRLEDIMVLV